MAYLDLSYIDSVTEALERARATLNPFQYFRITAENGNLVFRAGLYKRTYPNEFCEDIKPTTLATVIIDDYKYQGNYDGTYGFVERLNHRDLILHEFLCIKPAWRNAYRQDITVVKNLAEPLAEVNTERYEELKRYNSHVGPISAYVEVVYSDPTTYPRVTIEMDASSYMMVDHFTRFYYLSGYAGHDVFGEFIGIINDELGDSRFDVALSSEIANTVIVRYDNGIDNVSAVFRYTDLYGLRDEELVRVIKEKIAKRLHEHNKYRVEKGTAWPGVTEPRVYLYSGAILVSDKNGARITKAANVLSYDDALAYKELVNRCMDEFPVTKGYNQHSAVFARIGEAIEAQPSGKMLISTITDKWGVEEQ